MIQITNKYPRINILVGNNLINITIYLKTNVLNIKVALKVDKNINFKGICKEYIIKLI